jgi:hypothetical protein
MAHFVFLGKRCGWNVSPLQEASESLLGYRIRLRRMPRFALAGKSAASSLHAWQATARLPAPLGIRPTLRNRFQMFERGRFRCKRASAVTAPPALALGQPVAEFPALLSVHAIGHSSAAISDRPIDEKQPSKMASIRWISDTRNPDGNGILARI